MLRFPDVIIIGASISSMLTALSLARSKKRVLIINDSEIPLNLKFKQRPFDLRSTHPAIKNLEARAEALWDDLNSSDHDFGYSETAGYYFNFEENISTIEPTKVLKINDPNQNSADVSLDTQTNNLDFPSHLGIDTNAKMENQPVLKYQTIVPRLLYNFLLSQVLASGVNIINSNFDAISGQPREFDITVDGVTYHSPEIIISSEQQLPRIKKILQVDFEYSVGGRATCITNANTQLNLDALVRSSENQIEIRQNHYKEIVITGEYTDITADNYSLHNTQDKLHCPALTLSAVVDKACSIIPALKEILIKQYFTEPMVFAEDNLPIIGKIPEIEGAYLMIGLPNHIKFDPVFANLLSEQIVNKSADADEFSPLRLF